MNKYIKTILIITLFFSFLIFTYALWWMSLVGTILILFLSFLVWPKNSFKNTGFNISIKEILITSLIFIIVSLGTYWLISKIATENNILFSPFFQENLWYRNVLKTIGQTLNEEIVLGALLLGYTSYSFKKVNPIVISIVIALVFCLFHFLFFFFKISAFTNFGILSLPCLLSIFFVGIL